MNKNKNTYRHSAQAHAVKAADLLHGRAGLDQAQKLARLQAAVQHLATAMAHASAAVALAEQGMSTAQAPIDPEGEVTDDLLAAYFEDVAVYLENEVEGK